MRNLILEGTVVDIRPMVTGTRADGTPWASQTYALQVDGGGGYTSLVAFDIFDETRIRQWNIQMGEQLAVAVALSSVAGREGGYFTRVRAYKVMRGYEAINTLMTLMGGAQTYGNAQTLGSQPADLAQGLALLARLANAPTQRQPQAAAQPQTAAQPQAAAQPQSLSQNATPAPAQTMLFNPTPASRPGDDLPF